MELAQYWSVVRRWWWLIVASVLVATVSSYVSTMRVPRIYQATTTVMVGTSLQKANPTNQDLYISQQLAQTYAGMVRRRPILQGAANALGLPFIPSEGNVSARNVPGTQLLEIQVRDTDPERASALSDAIAQELILQSPAESGEDQSRRVFVQSQLERLFPGDENNERLPRLVAMLERAWALGGVRLDQDDLERELRALDRRSPETDEARTLLEVTRTILEWHCTAPQGGGSDELREKL